jgi:hypothetical protein
MTAIGRRGLLIWSAAALVFTMGAPSTVRADHVAVNPQPGFNTTEASDLVHTENSNPAVIAAQLRLGVRYVRLSQQRVAAGQLQEGPEGWWEPGFLGYKLVSSAHHGIQLGGEKAKKVVVSDPMLPWESKTINEARAHLRNGLEYTNHVKANEPGAADYAIQELNVGIALVQRVLAVMP